MQQKRKDCRTCPLHGARPDTLRSVALCTGTGPQAGRAQERRPRPLPANLERIRRKLKGSDDGDRQMVKILSAVLTDGLVAVEAACTEALAGGVHSADVILNILA